MSFFSKDVAVSLVDDSFIFSYGAQSTAIVIPAYVAIQTGTKRVLTCGEEAKTMQGKTPDNITVIRVLTEGIIGDSEAATMLFRFGLRRLHGSGWMVRPRVVVSLRSYNAGFASAKSAALAGGAREIYLLEMGMAMAIGMELNVLEADLKAVLSISDDWFEFCVITLAGRVAGVSGGIGTRAFVEDAQNHFVMSRQFLPDTAALEARLMSGGIDATSASGLHGWEAWAGRSDDGRMVEQSVRSEEITVGMMPALVRITERIKRAIRTLTNEQQYQLSRTPIHATGTAMTIPGLSQAIANQLGQTVTPFSSAVHPSIEGCKRALGELKFLRNIPVLVR